MSEILEARERHERASEAHEAGDSFSSRVSILVAALAVITAATSSLENTETAAAIVESTHAVLAQDRASDQWAFFEAKSLKRNMLEIAAQSAPAPRAADLARKAQKEGQDQGRAQSAAQGFEKARDAALEESARHEARHHRLAIAAALLEIGIAVSTVAIITRRHWPWVMAAILGALALLAAASAYL